MVFFVIMFSIYFGDLKGQLCYAVPKLVNSLMLEDAENFLLRDNLVSAIPSTFNTFIIGDAILGDTWMCIIAFQNIALPKPLNFNWGFYVKNMLVVYDLDSRSEIEVFINNINNGFRETQTLLSQYNVIELLLGDLTNSYTNVTIK